MSHPGEYESRTGEFLLVCSSLYDFLVKKTELFRKKASAEAMLAWVEMVAGFGAMHHPGRFFDGAIENIALEIGSQLQHSKGPRFAPLLSGKIPIHTRRRRILHVVTFISAQGGHTRNLLHWINKDQESHHSLVLTHQRSIPLYQPLMEAVALSGGVFTSMPDPVPLMERAGWLRRFAQETADLVILHAIPNDIVPIVAFADGCNIPVAFVNNGDHLFWLGSSVADTIINLREISIASSRECRCTRNDQLLPVPLVETHQDVGRDEARKVLGIPRDQKMLLTVGRALKYAPSTRQNFFETAGKILNLNPKAHLYLVGVRADDHVASSVLSRHDRVHFVGPVEDATFWQRAADVYLEGYPFGSQTALLESVLPGVPCVRVYAPLSPLLAADDIALTGVVESPADEETYIATVSEFINDEEKASRQGDILRKRVLRYHIEDMWKDFLTKMYTAAGKMKHMAVPVPQTSASVRQVDLAISEFHGTRYVGAADIKSTLTNEMHKEILATAYNLRQTGCYKDAFQLLKLANREKNWDRESILFAAKLIPHRFLYKRRLQMVKG